MSKLLDFEGLAKVGEEQLGAMESSVEAVMGEAAEPSQKIGWTSVGA